MDDQENISNDSVTVPANQAGDKNQAIILTNLEDLIISHIANIERMGNELKENRDTFENILLNEPVYTKHLEAVKEATKIKNATKKEILKRPDVARVYEKVKTIAGDIKDLKQELSEYLREYQRLSGFNQIQDKDGGIREIVVSATVVRRNAK